MFKLSPQSLYSNLFPRQRKPKTEIESSAEFQQKINQEVLDQVRLSYRVFCSLTIVSASVILAGSILFLCGKTTQAGVAAVAGFGVGSACSQLALDSKSKLEILLKETNMQDHSK